MHRAFRSDVVFLCVTSSLASLALPRLVGGQWLMRALCLLPALVGLRGAVRQL